MHTHPSNAHLTHTTHVQINIQLYLKLNYVHLEITRRVRRRRVRRILFVAPHVRGCRLYVENYYSRVSITRSSGTRTQVGSLALMASLPMDLWLVLEPELGNRVTRTPVATCSLST